MAVSLPVASSRSLSLTSDEALLGRAVDAGQVAVVLPAVLLGVLPRVSPAEVTVAVSVELPPGVVAALRVWFGQTEVALHFMFLPHLALFFDCPLCPIPPFRPVISRLI